MNKCHLPIFLTPAQAGTQQELRVLSRWLVNQVSVTEKARSGSQGQARDTRGKGGVWGRGRLRVNKWHLGSPSADSRALGKCFQRIESLRSGDSWGKESYCQSQRKAPP